MALRNKDGSVFKLNGPNPIMTQQTLWNDKYIIHNKIGRRVVIADSQEIQEPILKPQTKEPQIVESLGKKEEIRVESPNDPIQVWCQPANYVEVVDPLYGEKYKKIKYGKKFMFEAIIVEHEDLFMIFWTNTKAVTPGSVIYPRSRDKKWWRIESVKEDQGGYLMYASITSHHPDFSD